MAKVELGEKKKICFKHADIFEIVYESFLFVVRVFILFVLLSFLINGNAPLIYFFDFLFLKFSLYSTFVKKAILKFDIHSILFINCIPKVLSVIGHILTSQLVLLSI